MEVQRINPITKGDRTEQRWYDTQEKIDKAIKVGDFVGQMKRQGWRAIEHPRNNPLPLIATRVSYEEGEWRYDNEEDPSAHSTEWIEHQDKVQWMFQGTILIDPTDPTGRNRIYIGRACEAQRQNGTLEYRHNFNPGYMFVASSYSANQRYETGRKNLGQIVENLYKYNGYEAAFLQAPHYMADRWGVYKNDQQQAVEGYKQLRDAIETKMFELHAKRGTIYVPPED